MIRDRNIFRQEYKHAGGWWKNLVLSATAVQTGAIGATYDTTNLGFNFDDNPAVPNEEVQATIHMPRDWMEGSSLKIYVHWFLLEDNGDTDEDVKWDLLYRVYETGDAANGSFTTSENTVDVSALTQWVLLETLAATIDMTGKSVEAQVDLRLQRDTADVADDHPHAVLFKIIDMHYQTDQPGSWVAGSKWGT